jgi:Glycosyl transferase family 2
MGPPADVAPPAGVVVSVLIPCWNSAGSIERAIESVLEERSVPLECVVVDDGSTDGSLDVIRSVAARDARVVVVPLSPNVGVSEARNRGLQAVRGEWLTLLDADDRFLPGGLGTLVGAALGGEAAAVIGQQVWWDGHRRWQRGRYDIDDIRTPGRKSLAGSPGLLNYVSPHAKLLSRGCWQGLEFRGRVLGDQPWIIRALLRAGDRIEVLGETVYEWYRPAADVPATSITATTRASVDRGVEAIGVATSALREVTDEAALRLGSAEQQTLVARYTERLIATDLAAHVLRALERDDPEIGRVFEAIAAFIAAAPAGAVARSNALARRIIEPVLRGWARIPASGRSEFLGLLRTAASVDPRLHRRGAGRLGRLAVRIAMWGGAAGNARAGLLLTGLAARTRQLRHQDRSTPVDRALEDDGSGIPDDGPRP